MMSKNGSKVPSKLPEVDGDFAPPAAACKNGINDDIYNSILVLKSDNKISIENYITIYSHNQCQEFEV